MIQVILSNSKHPEYGQATIPFPLAQDQYEDCVELLEKLGIGDAVERDCKVEEIQGGLPILKRLEKVAINIDELDYLAKRLDSFDSIEEAQFQAMAVKLGTFDMTELINLTFCCQQATVITDFSDLDAVGRHHIMSINGGCAPSELAQTDLRMTALKLILSKEGTVTPTPTWKNWQQTTGGAKRRTCWGRHFRPQPNRNFLKLLSVKKAKVPRF